MSCLPGWSHLYERRRGPQPEGGWEGGRVGGRVGEREGGREGRREEMKWGKRVMHLMYSDKDIHVYIYTAHLVVHSCKLMPTLTCITS